MRFQHAVEFGRCVGFDHREVVVARAKSAPRPCEDQCTHGGIGVRAAERVQQFVDGLVAVGVELPGRSTVIRATAPSFGNEMSAYSTMRSSPELLLSD